MHANKDTIKLFQEIELFNGLDENFVNKLVNALRAQYLPPDEVVVVEGEIGRHMFLIRKGICQVSLKAISVHLDPPDVVCCQALLQEGINCKRASDLIVTHSAELVGGPCGFCGPAQVCD